MATGVVFKDRLYCIISQIIILTSTSLYSKGIFVKDIATVEPTVKNTCLSGPPAYKNLYIKTI